MCSCIHNLRFVYTLATASYSAPEQESQLCSFKGFLLYSRKYARRVYFEFMGGDNKHLYSFVGSHMLSYDLGVSLWLHLVN